MNGTIRRRGLMSGDTLPYDSKVEFLKSEGNAYINLDIIPDKDTGVSCLVTMNSNADTYILGLRNDGGNTRWCIGYSAAGFYYGYGGYTQASGITQTREEVLAELNWLNSGVFYTEHSPYKKTTTLSSLSFIPTYAIRLFGNSGIQSTYSHPYCSLYFVKISQGNSIVADLIPVRVGDVGYMYDKISKKLFGNVGSGSFIIGNDLS